MSDLHHFKDEFMDREGTQFSCAGLSPISRSVALEMARVTTVLQTLGGLADSELIPIVAQTRQQIARLIDAPAEEVAFAPNCATAISQIALGYPLKPDDTVVTVDQEYASNFYPWKVACQRSGARLQVVASRRGQITTEEVIAAVVPGVKVVGVSWVQFQTGSILDLSRLGLHCREIGAHLVVDGIQGIGQLPISFRSLPVDALVGASHKWVCGPLGQGFFAIRSELMERLELQSVGSMTYNRAGTYADPAAVVERTARRFEAGGYCFLALAGLSKAAELIADTGVDVISEEITRLTGALRRGLVDRGAELSTPIGQLGGITSFELPAEWEAKLMVRCREERIAIAKRGPYVRTAIHAFANDDEVANFLAILEGCQP